MTASLVVSTNVPRTKRQLSTRELIGGENWSYGTYPVEPFVMDNMYHAANGSAKVAFQVPNWATNVIVTYYAAADSPRAWTNVWTQEIYDTGIRQTGTSYFFPLQLLTTMPRFQANAMPIQTGKTNSVIVMSYYSVATNVMGNYYLQGPITVLFQ